LTVFLLILLMLALSAFFSGSEIAFVTANRLKTEARARQAGWVGGVVQEFMADPGTFLTTTLVGNNVALVVYSTLMSLALEPPLAAFFGGTLGIADPTAWVLITQTVIAALVVLVVGEVLPKSLLRQPPELRVDEREEAVQRVALARVEGAEETGDLRGVGRHDPSRASPA